MSMKDRISLNSLDLAEEMRQSHCDRKQMAHKCVGVMTIKPGVVCLDCEICGMDTKYMEESSALLERARAICRITGTDYDGLSNDQKRQLLLEITALAFQGL